MDGLESIDDSVEKLSYPFSEVPSPGRTWEVRPGVHWIRMPLPYALNHINLWAIDDGDGWAIVDTGTSTEVCGGVWKQLFANASDARSISRVFVTHMHPDHIGMAGWLTRKFSVRLWMTRLEYLTCRVMVSDTGREAPPEGIDFYRMAGWSESAIETYRLRFGSFGKHIYKLPETFRRISDGEVLTIGQNQWKVVVGSGHSPEHACLYCEKLKVLISGDQVLPRISSNVSVYPSEPDADPMNDWLKSLDKLLSEVPDNVLVLPSHNEPFFGLHARLRKLRSSQERSLKRLIQALDRPKGVVDVFGALFARSISQDDVPLLSMATGETIACLNYLLRQGKVERSMDEAGAYRYVASPASH